MQGRIVGMMQVKSPSQVCDGFIPFFDTLAALVTQLSIFLSGMQSARNNGRDAGSGISESGTLRLFCYKYTYLLYSAWVNQRCRLFVLVVKHNF